MVSAQHFIISGLETSLSRCPGSTMDVMILVDGVSHGICPLFWSLGSLRDHRTTRQYQRRKNHSRGLYEQGFMSCFVVWPPNKQCGRTGKLGYNISRLTANINWSVTNSFHLGQSGGQATSLSERNIRTMTLQGILGFGIDMSQTKSGFTSLFCFWVTKLCRFA